MRVTALVLLLAAAALAGDAEDTARAVIDAHRTRAAAALARLAAQDGTDPWLVADALVARGADETAAAYAAAVPDPRTRESLTRYLAGDAARPGRGQRETLRVAHEKRIQNDPKATLVALALVEPDASVVGVRMAHERAMALRDLGREEEGLRADVAAARLAHALGWRRQRDFLLGRLCVRHFNATPYDNDATALAKRSKHIEAGTAEVAYGWIAGDLVAAVATRGRVEYVPLDSRLGGVERILDYSPASPPSLVTALGRRLFDPLGLPAELRLVRVTPPPKFRVLPFAAFAPDRAIVFDGGTWRPWNSDEAARDGRGVVAVCDGGGERRDEVLAAGTIVLGPGVEAPRLERALVSGVPWRAVHLACAYRAKDRVFVIGDGPFGEIGWSALEGAFWAELLVISGEGAHRLWRIQRGPPDTDSPGRWLRRGQWDSEGVFQLGEKVPRVLLPIWQPDAGATRALMLRFYALWNPGDGKAGLPAAEALRRAQAHVRGQERWRHPYYWAGWQLWGRAD